MKWVAISGSWRKMNSELEKDVRGKVIDKAYKKGIPVQDHF